MLKPKARSYIDVFLMLDIEERMGLFQPIKPWPHFLDNAQRIGRKVSQGTFIYKGHNLSCYYRDNNNIFNIFHILLLVGIY